MNPVVAVAQYDNQHQRKWEVESDSNPNTTYTVTERATKEGKYLFCTCPSWPRSVQTGGCKHAKRIARMNATTTGLGPTRIGRRIVTDADIAAMRRVLGMNW